MDGNNRPCTNTDRHEKRERERTAVRNEAYDCGTPESKYLSSFVGYVPVNKTFNYIIICLLTVRCFFGGAHTGIEVESEPLGCIDKFVVARIKAYPV